MKKKEYMKPEVSVVEMTENTSILAGSADLSISMDEDFDEGEDNQGYGNGLGTSVWN